MTEEERYEKLNDKLDRILEKIDGKLQGVAEQLQNHEVRIVVLEQKPEDVKKKSREKLSAELSSSSSSSFRLSRRER